MTEARSAPSSRASVLVVDDDQDIRETVKEVLEDEGYVVDIAANGEEALARLQVVDPGLILLDLSMPVMNGSAFAEELKKDERLAAIPTVVLTAAGRAVQPVDTDGIAAFLQKPISLDALLALVEKYCGAPVPA
jgi:CheY-like chemotaxis protein